MPANRIDYKLKDVWANTESIYKYRSKCGQYGLLERVMAMCTFAVGNRSKVHSEYPEIIDTIARNIAIDVLDIIVAHTSKPGISFDGDVMKIDMKIYKEEIC